MSALNISNAGGNSAANGTVQSVGLNLPAAQFTVANSPVTMTGNLNVTLNAPTGTGVIVLKEAPTLNSPIFLTPALGTPASGVGTNMTGTGLGFTAGNVSLLSGAVVATQAQQEAASSTGNAVTPGTQQFHPSAAKAWALFDMTGNSITSSNNISGIVHPATGVVTLSFTVPMSSANYPAVASATTTDAIITIASRNTGNFQVKANNALTGAAADLGAMSVIVFGDQ